MLGQLAQQLPTHVGRLLIEEPGYEPARRALTSNLASLAELVGLEKALTDLAADWPADVHHPAAWASKRAARRLAEAHADAELVEQHVNTDAERREANRMAALRHAENLARTDVDEPMAIAHLQSSYGRSELWAEVEARFRERRGATRLPTAEHRAPNQADARRAAWAALETGRAAGKLRMSHPASTMADVAEPTEMAS